MIQSLCRRSTVFKEEAFMAKKVLTYLKSSVTSPPRRRICHHIHMYDQVIIQCNQLGTVTAAPTYVRTYHVKAHDAVSILFYFDFPHMIVSFIMISTYLKCATSLPRQPTGAVSTAKHILRNVQHVLRGNLVVFPLLSTFCAPLHSAVVG